MSMTVVVGILGGISSQGRILLDAGASVRTELHLAQEPAALAAGMVAVFALLAWITSTMRSGALTWKVERFTVHLVWQQGWWQCLRCLHGLLQQ
ncbi:hypothetical protein SAY86_019679 [Trapa natans]|uniref:Uncharacterized protein n=1 Tax=Trapa natans TaxID=22666 RepID=A0AAN7R4X5_TRANT|nr:hypothetical protein SAY86_019679 [Trapa natans]